MTGSDDMVGPPSAGSDDIVGPPSAGGHSTGSEKKLKKLFKKTKKFRAMVFIVDL